MYNDTCMRWVLFSKVSYVKYIDIWGAGCMAFLVAAITEYAIVYRLWWRPVEQLYRQHQYEDKYQSKQVYYRKYKITEYVWDIGPLPFLYV